MSGLGLLGDTSNPRSIVEGAGHELVMLVAVKRREFRLELASKSKKIEGLISRGLMEESQ